MKLYVNGDSHTAAAEAVNTFAFAEDDGRYFYLGRAPHPDNLAVSWGRSLADVVKAAFYCDAESASSNDRIIRTTREWLANQSGRHSEILMLIQWSTWEREEWILEGRPFQVTASGTDDVPKIYHNQYREWVAGMNWAQKTQQAHDQIWQFHCELRDQGVRHVFFNGNSDFSKITQKQDWGVSYISPYDPSMTFAQLLKNNGFDTVSSNSWHFGKPAHSFWSRFMLQYIVSNKLI